MALVKWTPRREWETLWGEMERLFERAFPEVARREVEDGHTWWPHVDMYETDEAYVVETDLPGMTAEDVTVKVMGHELVVKGERRTEHEETKEKARRVERTFGAFHRRVTLPEGVKAEEVEARYVNGVLTVTVPKAEEVKAKAVEVKAA